MTVTLVLKVLKVRRDHKVRRVLLVLRVHKVLKA
jgi:hypothetical protein